MREPIRVCEIPKSRRVSFFPSETFEAKEINVVYGKSGVGKTTVMTAIAEDIASGKVGNRHIDELDYEVLYFASEGYAHVIDKFRKLNDKSKLLITGGYFDIEGADNVQRLARACGKKVKMVIIDTLSASMSKGSKNDDATATKIFHLLKTRLCMHLGITVILIMHTGKDGKSITGSHQWASDVPVVWKVVKGKMVNEKFRNGATPKDIHFTTKVSENIQTANIEWDRETKTELSAFDQELITVYDNYPLEDAKQFMLAVEGKDKFDNAFHNKFKRAVDKLTKAGLIGKTENNT